MANELPEPLRSEVKRFLLERADRIRSEEAKRNYLKVAKSLARLAGIRSLAELDREAYFRWKRALVSEGISDFTLRAYIQYVKALIKWARGGELPSWLVEEKSGTWELYSRADHLRNKILSPEELEALLQACTTARDRAIIGILAETGIRVGELCSLRLRDVEQLSDGAVRLYVRGKTGVRTVVFFEAVEDLWAYMERERKGPVDPDAPLFTTRDGRLLRPKAVRTMLARLARKAGLKRPVHPHMLRHTRMTQLARVLTEQELKVVAGWSMTSKMPAVYVHLSGRDAETALRKARQGHHLKSQ